MVEGPINRTMRVLTALCEGGPQSLTDLAARVGLTPPTVLRILRIMRDEGFAVQEDRHTWRATMLMWRLGCAVSDSYGMGELTENTLRELSRAIDETVVFAAYADGWVTYAAQVQPAKPVRTHVPLGGRYSLLDTLTGKAVLAWLPPEEAEALIEAAGPALAARAREALRAELAETGRRRYVSGTGDLWSGVWGAAAPVFGRYGHPVGAVGVSLPRDDEPPNADEITAQLLEAARRLTQQFGGPPALPRPPSRPPA